MRPMELFLQFFPNFLLIFCRISSFLITAPVFSTRNVPATFKIGLAFFISLIAFALVGLKQPTEIDGLYFLQVLKEVLIGLLIGFAAYMFFTAVQIAGSFIDMQMGFAIANMIDPMTGASSPLMGNFKFMLAMLLFLSFNGHHYLIQAIVESYQWAPLDSVLFARLYDGSISTFLVETFAKVFAIAFQMSAPIVVALFLADIGLGILAKTAPQFNIFVVGLPLKIMLGLVLLLLMVTSFQGIFSGLFARMLESLQNLLRLLV